MKRLDCTMLLEHKTSSFDCNGSRTIQVLGIVTPSNPLPIYFFVSWGAKMRILKTKFILNVSHLQKDNCVNCIMRKQNLLPKLRGDKGWITWWEDTIMRTISITKGYGHQIAYVHQKHHNTVKEELELVSRPL